MYLGEFSITYVPVRHGKFGGLMRPLYPWLCTLNVNFLFRKAGPGVYREFPLHTSVLNL